MNNYDIKRTIIPEDWKYNIDEIMEEQLFNANRYYAENNPKLNEIIQQYSKLPSTEYLKLLKQQWKWHNQFYENLLEPAVGILTKKSTKELSPKEILELKKIYKTMCKVDEATLAISGGIKIHLKNNLKKNLTSNIRNDIDPNEVFMAYTPPEETFFIKYYTDHVKYLMAQKSADEDKINDIKKELLKKYHANDEKIMQGRLKKFANLEDLSCQDLEKKINELGIDKNYKIRHFYFTMENPEKKAYRDIILYDNLEEKQIAKSLIGISGFILRKKILEYLKEENLIESDEYIYQYPDDVIEKKLDEMYYKRKTCLQKNVEIYKQHGPTCAVCSLLMILKYYDKIDKPNKLMERNLYKRYCSSYIEGTHYSGIANQLARMGLSVKLLHSEEDYFKNNGVFVPEYFEDLLDEYKSNIKIKDKNKLDVRCGIDINSELIRKALENSNLVILAGQQSNFLHSIVISGYQKDKFVVCDSLCKERKEVSTKDIDKFMDTTIGKWCILVNDNREEKGTLIKQCDKFQKDAEEFLKFKKREEREL